MRPSQNKPTVESWTTGKMGGPGKRDTFKSPKVINAFKNKESVIAQKKAEEIQKKETKKVVAEKKALDKKEKLLKKAAEKRCAFQKKEAAKKGVPQSPATVVRMIATQASKVKFAETLASERPETNTNPESSIAQVTSTNTNPESRFAQLTSTSTNIHPLLGVVNEGNCRYFNSVLYCRYFTVLYCTAGTALYCTVLQVLHCIVL